MMTEAEEALMSIVSLIIGSAIVGDAERRAGYDKALAWLRDEFRGKKLLVAAATVERVRQLATDDKSNTAILEAFIASQKSGKKN